MPRLIPRDEHFFDLLDRAAALSQMGARVLMELLRDCDSHSSHARRLKDIEHAGDDVTRSIFQALHHRFVTPLEPADIGALASALDDVLDTIDAAGRRIWLYRLQACTPLARDFGQVLIEQTDQVALAVPLLRGSPSAPAILEAARELNRLEDEADDLLADALGEVYEGVSSVPELVAGIRWRAIYQLLEDATDRAEDVAGMLETINLKYG
jgi:uncharacterized protein Yka (UPF0111/DUF47 family)